MSQINHPQDHETGAAAPTIPSPTLPTLTIDEKRQVVYSSLLRYGTEAVSLRERDLNRAALGALIGSSADEPFRIGMIQHNLHYRSDAPEIRVDAIQERIARLIEADKVEHTELRKNHAYFLTNSYGVPTPTVRDSSSI